MVSSVFQLDDLWQKSMRNKFLAPFYKKLAHEGRYVFNDKSRCSLLLQKRYAIDTILQAESDRSTHIEEKIVRWKGRVYDKFFLETHSCTNQGHESDGWMVYAQADMLVYAFAQENDKGLKAYIIKDFEALKSWFWQVFEQYEVSTLTQNNRTRGRLVDIKDVEKNVEMECYYIYNDKGDYKRLR
jgi:hypothetical protein